MSIEVKVPGFPESVTDGTIVTWHVKAGDVVEVDDIIADIETDKVVFEIPAPDDGMVEEILEGEGSTVIAHQLIARLGPVAAGAAKKAKSDDVEQALAPSEMVEGETIITPSAAKLIAENNLNSQQINGTGKDGRVLKEDVLSYLETAETKPETPAVSRAVPAPELMGDRPEERVPMTRLRARIAERLVEAQQTAAILTTFNEINMQPVMELRQKYKDKFEKEHGVRLGFMSFFVKAAVAALKRFPVVNASIDGNDIVYHGFFDIGIAVGSPRGLVVPILRDTDQLSIAEIEGTITDLGQRAQEGKLGIEEITGGTFSITNGGVFGSLLSTPILNPPQSAILGMHKIQERPMVENGEIVIRPMMYLALSYDHRIIDGREAVQFLVKIKEALEDPARLLLDV
jgi:2-oxoglutarate dehydrogenase E2 component (dihydrolipoamide succinyltransferase)